MRRVDPSIAIVLLVLSTALGRASAQGQATVGGVVRDPQGYPQLGALVELLGPSSLVVAHTYTDDHGHYLLSALEPGRYQLRTTAAFLLPALRNNIRLTSGGRTLADITLSALFGTGDWFPVNRRRENEPADDWRWTLRSTAARPLLRLAGSDEEDAPGDDASGDKIHIANAAVAEGEHAGPERRQERLTTIYGSSGFLQDGWRQTVGVDKDYATDGVGMLQATLGSGSDAEGKRSLALQAGYQQRNPATHGEFRTVAALAAYPEIGAAGESGYQAVNLATGERIELGDVVTIDAGTLLSAERMVASRLSSSPFLRVSVHPDTDLTVRYRFAGSQALQSLDDMDDGSPAPTPLSDAGGRPLGKVGSHNELAVARKFERSVATLAVYQDAFVAGFAEGEGVLPAGETAGLPVVENSGNSTFFVGLRGYTARGVSASWMRALTPTLEALVQADLGTTMAARAGETLSLEALQGEVSVCNRVALTAELDGSIAVTATSFDVRYHWQPAKTLALINAFNTAPNQAYASVSLKQRLWKANHLRGVSAVVEASNLLEEGYQPVVGPDGETLFLAQVPRSLQAGLTFSF